MLTRLFSFVASLGLTAAASSIASADSSAAVLLTKEPLIVTSAGRERVCGYLKDDTRRATTCFPDLAEVPYSQRESGEIKVTSGMFCTFGAKGVRCSGQSFYMQLFMIPELSEVFDLALPSSADTGVNACALTRTQGAVCWGGNDKVRAIPQDLIEPQRIVTTGLNACALDKDATIKCWGENAIGASPFGVRNLQKLVMTDQAACAIDDYGMMCWGPQGSVPDELRGDGFIKDVTMTDSQICALTFENQVRCFGESPLEPPELLAPIALTSFGNTICATDLDGLKCWGNLSALPKEKRSRPPAVFPRPGRDIDP